VKNFKLTIQYDGTNYSGWQIQKNAPTIQQTISDSIKIILKEEINLIGSGRTDSGVHALGQVANFISSKEIELHKFRHSLNAILPGDIAIKQIEEVSEEFHARFSAVKRSYFYFISKGKSPFYENYSYRFPGKPELEQLKEISKIFVGEKDFTSFTKKNSEIENKTCNVTFAHWRETKELLIFHIEANRFLHGMVRAIVGTILRTATENYDSGYIKNIFEQKDRQSAWEAVPAKGLFLYKVTY
jgi:tRNA pseudouridine38-40 synthase